MVRSNQNTGRPEERRRTGAGRGPGILAALLCVLVIAVPALLRSRSDHGPVGDIRSSPQTERTAPCGLTDREERQLPAPAPSPVPTPSPKPLGSEALEELAGRVGWLRSLAPKPEASITGADFAGLCALLTGTPPETPAAVAAKGTISRQQAAAIAAASFQGQRLRLADFTDRERIAREALEGVEKLYAYGFFAEGGAFDPEAPLTWEDAAVWLNHLADLAPPPAPAAVRFSGFSAGGGKLNEGQQAALCAYFDLHHAAMADLKAVDMAAVFAPERSRAVELENTVLSCFIMTRRYSSIDLTMTAYSYALQIISAVPGDGGTVRVYLGEYGAMDFRGMGGETSEEPLVHHTFVLVPVDGTWMLSSHSRDDSGFSRFENARDRAAEGLAYLEEVRANLLAQEDQRGAADPPVPCGHPIDRDAAAAYALEHADTRNPAYADYTGRGGNCQNYVSQCLEAGGCPQDRSGEPWNTGSASWINVGAFKRYAQRNVGTGLAAQADAPYFAGAPGDVLQMGFVNDGRHAMLITGVLTDERGAAVDYKICSNTCNWRNMPMSAHWYTCRTLIKVYGWND